MCNWTHKGDPICACMRSKSINFVHVRLWVVNNSYGQFYVCLFLPLFVNSHVNLYVHSYMTLYLFLYVRPYVRLYMWKWHIKTSIWAHIKAHIRGWEHQQSHIQVWEHKQTQIKAAIKIWEHIQAQIQGWSTQEHIQAKIFDWVYIQALLCGLVHSLFCPRDPTMPEKRRCTVDIDKNALFWFFVFHLLFLCRTGLPNPNTFWVLIVGPL